MDHVIEPLAESAPLAWRHAPRLCPGDAASVDTCRWYHQVWQYLRVLGVITTVGTNDAFLASTFRALARSATTRRVLIAGSADYAMLARLHAAFQAESRPLDATVLDLCATSLWLNRWYAERVGLAIDTVHADALAFRTPQPFDAICTHNFLGRFDASAREHLIAAWRSLLRPGGVVITTLRVRPQASETRVTYTDEQARAFGRRVAEAARAHIPPLPVAVEELETAAYEYARRKNSHVIASNQEVTDAFERHGFAIVQADEGGGQAERARDRPASLAGKDTYRMRLIATRR